MKTKILILGGGFAGIEAAASLRKFNHDVTLVSDRKYLFIYPISIWVPVKKKNFEDVCIPLDILSKKHQFKLIIDKVKKIDYKNDVVTLEKQSLSYDYLIIALGMSKVETPGLKNTHSICGKPDEAIIIKEELEKLITKKTGNICIGFGGNPKDLTATAVRGGPAFELLFNISTYLKKKKLQSNFNLTFFAPMKEPGKKMGKKALSSLNSFFTRYKIESKTGVKIVEFKSDSIVFEDGNTLKSDLTIFISGGKGHSLFSEASLPVNDAGFIKINEKCQVQGINNIYAIGDSAALEGPDWIAKQGHLAEVMGAISAYNINNQIQGSNSSKGYKHHLNIVCVMDTGDGAAFVYRKGNFDLLIPMPIIGHWLKKAWGYYFKKTKLRQLPRLPGM